MMKLPYAMFHCIHATIYSLQNFENTAEVPKANLLKTETGGIEGKSYSKIAKNGEQQLYVSAKLK